MLTYPNIDPVALSLGPLSIRWYGLMYLVGFVGALGWCFYRSKTQIPPWSSEAILDLFFYATIGVIFGGTLGFLLFYEPERLLAQPWDALKFWLPGRSFHGGLIGVLIAIAVFARIHRRRFWAVGDFISPAVPIGLATGRLGNFLNEELWGRVTNLPWGMVFPHAGPLPRHPSQWYEFFLEGVLLFIILAIYSRKPRPIGSVSGVFLVCYGIFRAFVEFFREPGATQGFLWGDWLTMGQLLSLPMILFGLYLIFFYAKPIRKEP